METVDGVLGALAVLNEGQTLGRYELLAPVGRGGMAIVWAARQRGTHGFAKIVAIKTMLPALAMDVATARTLLAEEAYLAAKIEHPNVCRILDLGEERGVLYLVLEWVDGEPLTTLSRLCAAEDRDLPCEVTAFLLAKAARGLAAAHELRTEAGEPFPVVHRDVSPQNILVTATGLVKVVDFGVAKAVRRSGQETASGIIKGKVGYLAPEQVHGRDIDPRADVFALGTVLHELVAGAHPFLAETDLATLLALSSPDPVRAPGPDVPEALARVLERALAKDKTARYGSMREMAADLEAFAASRGATEDSVAALLAELLEEKRASRAARLRAASLEADARTPAAPVPIATAAAAPSPLPVSPSPRPRSPAFALGLAAASLVGLVVGISLTRAGASAPASVSASAPASVSASASVPVSSPVPVPVPASVSSPAPAPAPAPVSVSASAPAPAPASAHRLRSPLPAASASASASAPAPGPSASASAPPASTIFRRPGF